MSKKVVIIGGGIIGLCTAYYLQKEGHQVTVVDKSDMSGGASYVNAGYIAPSHIIPLAHPGIITQGIKWMFDATSPFYVRPRIDLDFLKWTWNFKKSSTKQKVEKAIPIIKNINVFSRELYTDLKNSSEIDFHFERKGLLMCYKSDKAGEEEWKVGQRAIQEGLKVENLSAAQVSELEPNANLNVKGAVYYHSDAHMTPNAFMKEMRDYLKSSGVAILSNEEVLDIEVSNEEIIQLKTNKQTIKGDEFVLASGSWSSRLSKKLGVRIPIQAGKGYSINVEENTGISIPAILMEAKVAVTPMDGFTRFAGTMEIDKINHRINPKRVSAIAKASEKYYDHLKIPKKNLEEATCGLRPCTPDGLPYIGKTSNYVNFTIATGHAMMGWSLGPATGKLVSEIISGKKVSLDLNPFNPERKF